MFSISRYSRKKMSVHKIYTQISTVALLCNDLELKIAPIFINSKQPNIYQNGILFSSKNEERHGFEWKHCKGICSVKGVLYASIYITFCKCKVTHNRTEMQGAGRGVRMGLQREKRKPLTMADWFLIWIIWMISWVFSHVKHYQLVCFKYMQITACQLYFNKMIKSGEWPHYIMTYNI